LVHLQVESLNIDKENVIYFGLFLPLGILIFKAIDKVRHFSLSLPNFCMNLNIAAFNNWQFPLTSWFHTHVLKALSLFVSSFQENKTLLKWATAVFLALQLFGVIIRLKYGVVYSTGVIIKYSSLISQYPQHSQRESEIRIETYKILALELILTLSYFVTLCIYERQLESFPGRIYTHGGNAMIPLYSTNSSTYFLPSDQHSGHHGNRLLSSGSPFFEPPPPYSSVNNLAGMTITSGDGHHHHHHHQSGQGQFHQYHHPSGQIPTALPLPPLQQPCSSRSVFANIGRIRAFGSKNKSSPSSVGSSHHHHSSNHHLGPVTTQQHQQQPLITQTTGGVNNSTSGTTTTLVVVTAQNHHNSSIDNQISNESDSPNAALLENHRRTSQDSSHTHRTNTTTNHNNSTTGGVGGGCGGGFLLSSSRRSIKDLD